MTTTGSMRERVEIQRATTLSDGAGGNSRFWVKLITVWAEVLPLQGKEAVLNESLQGVQAYRVMIRHRPTVIVQDRLLWRGALLNIISTGDPDGRRTWTEILATAGVVTQ